MAARMLGSTTEGPPAGCFLSILGASMGQSTLILPYWDFKRVRMAVLRLEVWGYLIFGDY